MGTRNSVSTMIEYNMIILYFRLPYFHVSNSALLSTEYFSTLTWYRHSLDTLYEQIRPSIAIFRPATISTPLQWPHSDHDDVSNHKPHGCLLNRLFRRRSKKTSKLRVTGLCAGNSPGPVNSLHKGPVTRKMFPFDDVIMQCIKFVMV